MPKAEPSPRRSLTIPVAEVGSLAPGPGQALAVAASSVWIAVPAGPGGSEIVSLLKKPPTTEICLTISLAEAPAARLGPTRSPV